MQGTDPVHGSAEKSGIQSEGQFVGGLFHYFGKGAFAAPNERAHSPETASFANYCSNWS